MEDENDDDDEEEEEEEVLDQVDGEAQWQQEA